MATANANGTTQLIPVSVQEVLDYATENRTALAQGAVGGAGGFQEWLEDMGRGKGIPLLKGLNLRHADLSFGDFSGIESDGSTFEGALLDGASFEGARMPHTCFKGAMVRDVSFAGAELRKANFNEAKIIGSGPLAAGHSRRVVDFTAADAAGSTFEGAFLRNTLFTHAQLPDSRFNGAELENVRFNGANMIGVNFHDAKPNFHQTRGVHNHPVGIETTGSILISGKHAEAFDGRLEDAITTPKQMVDALSRALAVCRAGFPNYPHARRQVEVRRTAAEMLVERYPQKSAETGIADALQQLEQLAPSPKGRFSAAELARKQKKGEASPEPGR